MKRTIIDQGEPQAQLPAGTPLAATSEVQKLHRLEIRCGAPAETVSATKADAPTAADSWIERRYRNPDDPECLMYEWIETFRAENGRPPKRSEVLTEWERRFKPLRGEPSFGHFWWSLPPDLKGEAGRPSGDDD